MRVEHSEVFNSSITAMSKPPRIATMYFKS